MSNEIRLTRGMSVRVDDDVWEWLVPYNWYAVVSGNRPYARRCAQKGTVPIYLHRMIAGVPSSYKVRFIDHDSTNCQRYNLRIEGKDRVPLRGWTGSCRVSKFKGVEWCYTKGVWRSSLCGMLIGHYSDEISAALAWNQKIEELDLNAPFNDLRFLDA